MKIRHAKHQLTLFVTLLAMLFFFYRGFVNLDNDENLHDTLKTLEGLQVQLHRDVLRYRNGELRQYDTLNNTLDAIHSNIASLVTQDNESSHLAINHNIEQLIASFNQQELLIEDFKTHNSVVQNSLIYFSRMHDEFYGDNDTNENANTSAVLLGRLSSLILAYSRKPTHETAARIYPLLDVMNEQHSSQHNALVNHSLMIIERLPEIDAIIDSFNTINIDHQIDNIEKLIAIDHENHAVSARNYIILILALSLYLVGYVVFMFIMLRKSRNTLEIANSRLSDEVSERTRTQRALYLIAKETSSLSEDDYVPGLLTALCTSLNVGFACFTLPPLKNGYDPVVIGMIDNGHYNENITCKPNNSPYQDIIDKGRLLVERNLKAHYPEWAETHGSAAEFFLGIALRDTAGSIIGVLAVGDDKPAHDARLVESILSLAASRLVTERRRNTALQVSLRYQKGLEQIDHWVLELIASANDPGRFFETVCTAAAELTLASTTLMPKIDAANGKYTYIASAGADNLNLRQRTCSIDDDPLCAWVIREGKSVRIIDVRTDKRTQNPLVEMLGASSALVTPIYLDDSVHSIIAVFRNDAPFDEIDEQLLNLFAQRVQLALMNKKLVAELAAEKERAEITLHSIGDAVITTGSDGLIEYMNNIAEQLTGWTLADAADRPVQQIFRVLDIDTREPMHNVVEVSLTEGTAISKSMLKLVEKNNDERDIKCSMSPITRASGKHDGVIIVFHDETERRRMEHFIHHQATHDSLTGLINRDEFNSELSDHIYDAEHHDKQHTLCYLDLDRFKLVNDTSGHAAGDELLKQITTLLSNIIRSGDVLGRLGGDEFGLILQGCPIENADIVASKIIDAITEHRFAWEDKVFSIGVSIGLVSIGSETVNATEVMKCADVACYTAKDLGRGRAYVYEHQDSELIRRHEELHWASKISEGLEKHRFRLFAQAITPLDTDKGYNTHIEILVRMEDENGKLVPPGAFIPAAERYNLMSAVDKHIIDTVFRFIAETVNSDRLRYSINLSGNSLNEDSLASAIRRGLERYAINPELICFEITETAAITNLSNARRLIDELKQTGCEFALDDFGSGLSSFGYLKNLPVDYLKIDGSFVRDMDHDVIDHAMVAAINQVGHVMGIKTIAEFVENDVIVDKLRDLGVDFAQGYHIARPAPLEQVVTSLLSATGSNIVTKKSDTSDDVATDDDDFSAAGYASAT